MQYFKIETCGRTVIVKAENANKAERSLRKVFNTEGWLGYDPNKIVQVEGVGAVVKDDYATVITLSRYA